MTDQTLNVYDALYLVTGTLLYASFFLIYGVEVMETSLNNDFQRTVFALAGFLFLLTWAIRELGFRND